MFEDINIKETLIYIGVGLLVALLIGGISLYFLFLERVELLTLDLRYRLRPRIPTSDKVGIIDIDDSSMEVLKQFPVPRRYYKYVLDVIKRYKGKAVGFDIFFPEPGPVSINKEILKRVKTLEKIDLKQIIIDNDKLFEESIKNSGFVYLAVNFKEASPIKYHTQDELDKKIKRYKKFYSAKKKKSIELMKKFSIPYKKEIQKYPFYYYARAYDVEVPIPRFLKYAKGAGFAQIVSDIDGVVRKYPLVMYYDGRLYFTCSLIMFMDIMKIPYTNLKIVPGKYLTLYNREIQIKIPVDTRVRMLCNWAGTYHSTYLHIPLKAILFWEAIYQTKKFIREKSQQTQDITSLPLRKIKDYLIREKLADSDPTSSMSAQYIINKLYLANIIETFIKEGASRKEIENTLKDYLEDRQYKDLLPSLWFNNVLVEELSFDSNISFENFSKEMNNILREYHYIKNSRWRYNFKMIKFLIQHNRIKNFRPLYFFEPLELTMGKKKKRISPLNIVGKYFFIGLTATGTHDLNPTPFQERYPMVGLHVNALNSLLTQNFLHYPPGKKIVVRGREFHISRLYIPILLGILTALISSYLKAIPAALLVISIAGVYVYYAYLVFVNKGIWLTVVEPLLTIFFTFLTIVLHRFLSEQKDKLFLKNLFGTYISPELIEIMHKNRQTPKLGGESGIRTAFFTDIQGFSTFSEQLSPTKLVELLNEYLSEMTDILLSERGTLDKYEGDAIVAFFGAPMPLEDHALRACRTAVKMQRKLAKLREKWSSEGDKWPHIVHIMRMRIGINSGEIVTGNMGSRLRMNYTMMGDAVNLAARLEAAAKQYGVYTLISENTLKLAGVHNIEIREIDKMRVVGKKEPVVAYELLEMKGEISSNTEKLLEIYNKGLELYKQRKFEEALSFFYRSEELEEKFEGRPTTPSKIYIERCKHFIKNPPPQNWDGVWVLTKK